MKNFFECTRTNFKTINLTPVECDKKTILIIGQPHSIEKEIGIIDLYYVYVKPHPLHDIKLMELN